MNKFFNPQGNIKYTRPEKHFLMIYKSLFFVAEFLSVFSVVNASDVPATLALLLAILVAGITCVSPAVGLVAFAVMIVGQFVSACGWLAIVAMVCLVPFVVSSQLMVTLIMMATAGLLKGEFFSGQLFLAFVLACFVANRYEKPNTTKLSVSLAFFAIYFGACYSLRYADATTGEAFNELALEALVFATILGLVIMLTLGLIKINFKLPKKWQKNLSNDCVLFLIIMAEIIALSLLAKSVLNVAVEIQVVKIIGEVLSALALSRLFSNEGLVALLKKKAHRVEHAEKEGNGTRDEKILTSLSLSKKEYRKSLLSYIISGILIAGVSFSLFMTIQTELPMWIRVLISVFSFGLPFAWEFGDVVLPKKFDSDSEKIFFSFASFLNLVAKIKDIILAWYIAIVVIITYRKAIKKAPKESQEKREQKGVKDFFENLINQIVDILSNASGTGLQSGVAANTAYAGTTVATTAVSETAVATGATGALSSVTNQLASIVLSAAIVAGGVGATAPLINPVDEPEPIVVDEPVIEEPIIDETDENIIKFKDYRNANGILVFPEERNRPPHATYEILDEFTVTSSADSKEKTLIAPEDGIYGMLLDVEGYTNMEFMDGLYDGTIAYYCIMGTYENNQETGYSSSGYGTSVDAKHTVRNIMTITCNKGDTIFYRVPQFPDGNKITAYFVRYKTGDDDPIDQEQSKAISTWGQHN